MDPILSLLISVIGGVIVIFLTPAFSWLKKIFTNVFGNHKRNKQIEKFGIFSFLKPHFPFGRRSWNPLPKMRKMTVDAITPIAKAFTKLFRLRSVESNGICSVR